MENKIQYFFKKIKSNFIKKDAKINDFYIGFQHIILIEISETPDKVVFNKLIPQLIIMNINIFWFKNLKEMEDYGDLFITNLNDVCIILLG